MLERRLLAGPELQNCLEGRPHLPQNLMRVAWIDPQISPTRPAETALGEALDRIHFGGALLDSDGRVLLTNRAMDEVLAKGDGLCLLHRMLRAATPAQTTVLRDQIRRVVATPPQPGVWLSLGRCSGKRPLAVLVSPIGAFHSNATASGGRHITSVQAIYLNSPDKG